MENSSRRGLTVIEVLISLALVSIAALGLIAAMTRIMLAQSSTSHQTVASIIAESKLQETILAYDMDSAQPIPPSLKDGSEKVSIGQSSLATDFFYDTTAVRMVKPAGSIYDTGRNMGTLVEFQCKVFWNVDSKEEGPQGAVERGTQTVTATRLAYIDR